jgi:O-antigen/teichoic acid export membrane protein
MRRPNSGEGAVVANIVARVGALVSLALATLIVARLDGADGVGVYALLRVLAGLTGVLISGGLPGAVAYFLAGPSRSDARLQLTIVAMALLGGVLGSLAWLAASPVIAHVFFRGVPVGLVAWASLLVASKLLVASGKGCCQGGRDLRGANWVILLEELTFLPAYGIVYLLGVRGMAAMIAGLLLADVATAAVAWGRLARRGFFAGAQAPSATVARAVWSYGMRGQIGGVLLLVNLRLDLVILGWLAGPAVVGIYAIASKFAELLRLVPLALTYVLYPSYAHDGHRVAAAKARRLLPVAAGLTAAATLPMAVAAGVLLPVIYGEAFRPAVLPAQILLVGLAGEGAAGVVSGFLYGDGRPGLNSVGIGAGVVVTVVLDLLLIPHHGAVGAAVASSAAYLTTTGVLLLAFRLVTRDTGLAPRSPGIAKVP